MIEQDKVEMPDTRPSDTAHQWAKDVSGLVSPPDVCIKLFELIESNQASAHALGEIISRDPSLTAKLLRIVNSSFFHFSRRIDTVSRAIAVIGISELYSLVIAVSAIKSFSKIPNFIVNIDTFWRHSIYTGLLARALARRRDILHPERLFVTGLLHDIGSLVIYNRAPDTAKGLLLAARGNESIVHRTERQALGFDHAELGGLLLEHWHLPEHLREAVRCHHAPDDAATGRLEAAIVHIADALANHSELGALCETPAPELFIEEAAWHELGLDPEAAAVEDALAEAKDQYRDTLNLFGT